MRRLGDRGRTAVVTVAVLGALAGCSAPQPPAPASPAPPAPAPTAPAGTPDQVSCQNVGDIAETVRGIGRASEQGPVLPAAVALVLIGPRQRALTPGIADAELAAAQIEFAAAIDELDGQGRAGLPPGGNPAKDTVQLDPTRILAAAEQVEALCAAPR